MKRQLPVIFAFVCFTSPAFAHGEERHADAHVHGKATLTLALEGKTLSLDLMAPGANFASESGDVTIDATDASGALVLDLPKAAKCSVTSASLEATMIESDDHDDHDHADHKDHHDSDDHDDHDGDDHDDHVGHTDMRLQMNWACKSPAKLKSATVSVFETWTGFEEVQTLFLTDNGANAQILTPSNTRIDRP